MKPTNDQSLSCQCHLFFGNCPLIFFKTDKSLWSYIISQWVKKKQVIALKLGEIYI